MDPKWEFNANQYVDFNNLDREDNSTVDEFFNYDMESGERVEKSDQDIKEVPAILVTPAREDSKKRQPANLVTSWGPNVVKAKMNNKEVNMPHKGSVKRNEMMPRRAQQKAQVEASVAEVRNSPRLAANRTPKRLGTNSSEPRLGLRSRSSSNTSQVVISKNKPSAALPKTPEVMKRYRAKMALGQQEFIKNTQGVKAIKSKLAKVPPSSKQSIKKKTVNVDSECRSKTPSSVSSDAPSFSRMLRSYNKQLAGLSSTTGITQPVPFKFAPERKRRHSADTKFKSQAEMIQNFLKGTPDRFRSRPVQNTAGMNRSRHRSASPATSRVTIPKTPQLSTRGRSRPINVLSKEQLEELELEDLKSKQFKAKAVGETIPKFKYGDVERKPCTKPQPFHLTNDGRPLLKTQSNEEEENTAFHAKPVPKGIMQAPRGIPEKKVVPVIEPQSPAFALKNRMVDRKPKIVKVRAASHRGIPVSLQTLPPMSKKTTVAEPFSFEQRDKLMIEKKEEKIRQYIAEEKKAREFHAQPIMKEEVVKMPPIQKVAPTKPEPFKLQIEERVENRLTQWQANVEKELEDQKKAAVFKANEPKVLTKAPFEPKPSEKPLSEISNFTLHSDRRAEERHAFDLKLKQKEAEIEGAKREQEERRKREEEEEIAELRKAAVHKAQPIRAYKPIEVKPSEKPLTLPHSPKFLSGGLKGNAAFNAEGN